MAAVFKRNIGFTKINTFGNKIRLSQLWEEVKLEENWLQVRFVGPVSAYGVHWLTITSRKGEVNIPKYCHAYDPETQSRDHDKRCPYCEMGLKLTQEFYCNAIIREEQGVQPDQQMYTRSEQQTGFKSKESASWTPVKVVKLMPTLVGKIQKITELNRSRNKHGEMVIWDINHPTYGCDLYLSYRANAAGPDKYQVQKGDRTPLTEEEESYLLWDIEDKAPVESLDEAYSEAESLRERVVEQKEAETPTTKSKRKNNIEELSDDEGYLPHDTPNRAKNKQDLDDDLSDFDDEIPAAAPPPPRRAAAAAYDDEDTPAPPKKRVAPPSSYQDDDDMPTPAPKNKGRAKDLGDLDDDLDDFDADDIQTAPKVAPKKSPVNLDDDADDLDDFDAPPRPVSKRKSAPAPKKAESFDDADEDEPAPRPVSKRMKPGTKKEKEFDDFTPQSKDFDDLDDLDL